ncbi:hypothetical protein QUB04_29295, partial [Microcoleus sp. D2_18a_B4]
MPVGAIPPWLPPQRRGGHGGTAPTVKSIEYAMARSPTRLTIVPNMPVGAIPPWLPPQRRGGHGGTAP